MTIAKATAVLLALTCAGCPSEPAPVTPTDTYIASVESDALDLADQTLVLELIRSGYPECAHCLLEAELDLGTTELRLALGSPAWSSEKREWLQSILDSANDYRERHPSESCESLCQESPQAP